MEKIIYHLMIYIQNIKKTIKEWLEVYSLLYGQLYETNDDGVDIHTHKTK